MNHDDAILMLEAITTAFDQHDLGRLSRAWRAAVAQAAAVGDAREAR